MSKPLKKKQKTQKQVATIFFIIPVFSNWLNGIIFSIKIYNSIKDLL
jgi:hypothetical protein